MSGTCSSNYSEAKTEGPLKLKGSRPVLASGPFETAIKVERGLGMVGPGKGRGRVGLDMIRIHYICKSNCRRVYFKVYTKGGS